jgi:hypothetical protein
VKYRNGGKNERNNEHDKIIQYFPHHTKTRILKLLLFESVVNRMLKFGDDLTQLGEDCFVKNYIPFNDKLQISSSDPFDCTFEITLNH